jgi:phosphoribosylformimino-5-aminoimidazole carboxamide ribotide isomerase
MQVIPAVDVLGEEVVRLTQGDYARVTTYDRDPVAVASRFVQEGATLVHVVDLEAARGGRRSMELLERLGAAGVPFQIGGGIRTGDVAREAIDMGAQRVVVGSAFIIDVKAAEEIIDAVGAGAVVAAIDVRDGMARGSGWLDDGIPLSDVLAFLVEVGIERALITGIEKDGTMEGPALQLCEEVRVRAPGLTLIASGGVGSLDDLRTLAASGIGIEAVIVGRALYESRFTLPEAIAAST